MLSNDGYAEKEWTFIKVMLSLLVIIGILSLIEIGTIHPNNSNHLNAAQLFVRMQDGQLHPFEVSASANLHDVYEAVKAAVGHDFTLTFHGEPLPNDESVFIAEVGIGPECVIDVSPKLNDLQILDRAVENPNIYLWPKLMHYPILIAQPPLSGRVKEILSCIDSYESLVIAAERLNMDVFKLAQKYLSKSIGMEEATGKIFAFDSRICFQRVGSEVNFAAIDLNVLSKLTELKFLKHNIDVTAPEIDVTAGGIGIIDLKGLGKMKKLVFVELYPECDHVSTSTVKWIVIPDMSKCTNLRTIKIHPHSPQAKLIIDCKKSKLDSRQIQNSPSDILFFGKV